MNKDQKFFKSYFRDFITLIENCNYNQLIKLKKIILNLKKKNKIVVAGNGGSAAISSHFSVDLTKNAKVRSINFNESDLITCFSNDYGYEKWVEKAVSYYCDKGDVLILISSSGQSPNILNAGKFFKKKKIGKLITFTGHSKNNKLKKIGDLNFWVNSKSYNLIENVHQFLLLSVVDIIIGKSEYSARR
tara:strand:- start:130 stop:696 length:567 start_codon:yes stop_codon:yes gene_type:complete